jgi:uncharacterized protein (DUF4213/DUF364 family)
MPQLKQLLGQIASEHLLIPTLEIRRSDSLDFHTVSVWAVEAALNAAFDAGRKSTESDEIDVHDLLARRKQIAVIWDVEDVQEVRPDLTDEQAWEVLKQTRHQHDATLGINWETLEFTAQMLFGDAPESNEA